MKEKQELHCHNCSKYVQFELDLEMNGNHVLKCPNCGHEHCRVVTDGKITGDRWDQRNDFFRVQAATSTASSIYDSYATVTTASTNAGTSFLSQSWLNTTA